MAKIYFLLGLGCFWCAIGFAQDPMDDKILFESAFGQRKARVNQRISMPVVLDQKELGFAEIDTAASPLRVSVKNLSLLLKSILNPPVMSAIQAEAKNAWINFDELSKLGVKAEYSAQKLTLDLIIDASLRQEKSIQIDQRGAYGRESMLPIAEALPYSLILNTRVVQSWQQTATAPTVQTGRIYTDWAGRAFNWVGELSGSFVTNTHGGGFNRTDSRLVRDWSDEAVRLILGDSLTTPRGALGPQAFGGIRLSRQFAINPRINSLSQPSDRLSLNSGAAVDVDVNGFLTRTLRLDPGVYNLRDIHAFQGANDISIRVVEPGGRVTVKKFDYFFDSSLLAPGLHEWDVAWGTPSTAAQSGRAYTGEQKVSSGWWRKGWASHWTAGGGIQTLNGLGLKSSVTQVESTWINRWGLWAAWLAQSSREVANNANLNGRGYAQMLQWRTQTSQRPNSSWSGNFTLQATRLGKSYSSLENTTTSFATNDVGARAGISWDQNWSASLAASRRVSEDTTRNNQVVTFGVRRRIDREWNIESTLGQSQNVGIVQNFFTIALRYSPFVPDSGVELGLGSTSWSASSSYQSSDHRWKNDAEFAGVSSELDAAWRFNVSKIRSDAGDEATLQSRVQAGRGEATWTTIQTQDKTLGASAYHELTLSNGFVMSGAGVKLSRPIYDSAVVFRPKEGFEPYKLLVDPQTHLAAAASDRLGTPVLSSVFSYSAREVQLDLENLPPGMSIGNDRWMLSPKYRSVIEIPVGSDAKTQLSGILTNMDGVPLALQSLKVLAQDKAVGTYAPVELFANRKGQFMTPPLSPGRYQIVRHLDDALLYQFEVLPKQSGIQSIGTLKVRD